MNEVARVVGYCTMILIACFVLMLAVLFTLDGVRCARFVIRRLRFLPNAGFKPEYPKYRTAIRLWWKYFIGTADRPIYVGNPETDICVYWPGRENEDLQNRYPG